MNPADTTTAIATYDPRILTPVMNLSVAKQRLREFQEFVKDYLVEGEDFGTIPGTPKPTLYKPGADKLCELYGLADTYPAERISRVERWDMEPPLFDYEVTCVLLIKGTDIVVAEGLGSCNSYEGRYRWRDAQRKCPQCGKEAIIKGKDEYGGGWVCFKKKGGCGYKFEDNDPAITSQEQGKIPNDDIATLKNTILKMAKKRAKIDATLSATRSSGVFTQDMEDIARSVDAGTPEPPPAAPEPVEVSGIIRLQETDKNQRGEYYRFTIGEKSVCAYFNSPVVSRLIDQQGKQVTVKATQQGSVYALTEVVSVEKPKVAAKKAEPAPKSEPAPTPETKAPAEEASPILDAANLPAGQKGAICTFKKFTAMKTKATPGKPSKPYILIEAEDENGGFVKLFCWNTKMTDAVTKSVNKRCDIAFTSKPYGEDTLFTLEGFISIDGVPTDIYGKEVLTPEHIGEDDIPIGEEVEA